ncbi:MAG TPA: DinB family protein [bacterium]|nr:DinB family protein [bacterium]
MADPIVTAWQTHCRLSSKFWDAIPAASLECKPTAPGRSIGQMLAHIHNNRLNWLEPLAPDLARSVPKIPKEWPREPNRLADALRASGEAVEKLLARSVDAGGAMKGFRGHAANFLGYLISHESYHNGQIAIVLKQAGTPAGKQTAYALWDWRTPK